MEYLVIILLNSYEEDTGHVQEEVAWKGELARIPLRDGRLVVDEIAAIRAGSGDGEAPEPLPFDVAVIDISRQPDRHRTRVYLGSALSSHAERREARRILLQHFAFRHEWALTGPIDAVCDDVGGGEIPVVVDVSCSPYSPQAGDHCARLQRTMDLGDWYEPGWDIQLARTTHTDLPLAEDDFMTEMAASFLTIEGIVDGRTLADNFVMASTRANLGVDPRRVASMLVTEFGFVVRTPDPREGNLVPVPGVAPPLPGDIVEIPLPDGRYGYARYDRYTENDGSLVTILRVTAERMAEPETLADTDPAFGPIHTGIIHSVLTRRWRVVGQVKVPDPLPARTFRHWEAPRYGRAGGWEIYADGEFTHLGPKLPRERRNLEMLWLWPCEDLEHRIMTGTSPHLERMREFE